LLLFFFFLHFLFFLFEFSGRRCSNLLAAPTISVFAVINILFHKAIPSPTLTRKKLRFPFHVFGAFEVSSYHCDVCDNAGFNHHTSQPAD
jgi:hypothetical protein